MYGDTQDSYKAYWKYVTPLDIVTKRRRGGSDGLDMWCGKSKLNHGKHYLAGCILKRRYHVSSDWYQSLYETIYHNILCGPNCVLLAYIYILIIICRIMDIPDRHFKIQDDGQVWCRYQFHMNPYIVKCMCTNDDPPVVVNIF